MRTPEHFVTVQQGVAEDVRQHFAIQADGSFTRDIMMFEAVKGLTTRQH
jgi:hypothetical protein